MEFKSVEDVIQSTTSRKKEAEFISMEDAIQSTISLTPY